MERVWRGPRHAPPDRLGLWLALALLAIGPGGAAAGDLPIVDTHIHYSRDAWTQYPPEAVLALLDQGGVTRAFVSSTPDDGTVRLYEAAPDRIVPVLRPYRDRGELGSWLQDPGVVAHLEGRLRRGIYRGIGEFHLHGTEVDTPVVRQVVDLARRHGLFLHCHCDVAAVEVLLGLGAELTIVWAHAGMSAGPDVVAGLLDRFPRLMAELALRGDVAPGGRLDPAWRAVFLRHADRFMVGTDTWVVSRWAALAGVQAATRAWLQELPPDVARRIARENAERLARRGP